MRFQKIMKNNFLFLFFIFANTLYANNFNNEDSQIIQPGAPGKPSIILNQDEATNIANSSYTKADVNFLQGMIVHHDQAVLMSRLAEDRTNNKTIVDLAKRIESSQIDEINFMQSWLKERDENASHDHLNHHMHMKMMGMASEKQLKDLKNSKSTKFDRLFLSLMIAHHDGALEMVKDLKKYPGSAYDPILNEFVSDLVNDQGVEIERMNIIAVGLSDDPRAGLTGGLYIADEAILNLELVASLKKPVGFFDPDNPEEKGSEDLSEDNENKTTEQISRSLRSPMLSFSNTDMAFKDDLLVAGSYHGFNMYQIDSNGVPNLITSVVCPGGQGDVSIVEHCS